MLRHVLRPFGDSPTRLWYNRCALRKTLPVAPGPEIGMKPFLLALGTVIIGALFLYAADKDTSLAANTRSKKLAAKVTVDFKDEMLDECIKELSRQIDDAGGGSLSASYDV